MKSDIAARAALKPMLQVQSSVRFMKSVAEGWRICRQVGDISAILEKRARIANKSQGRERHVSNWYGSFAVVHSGSFCAQIVAVSSAGVRGSLLARKCSTPFRIAEIVPFSLILFSISLMFVSVTVQQGAEEGYRTVCSWLFVAVLPVACRGGSCLPVSEIVC